MDKDALEKAYLIRQTEETLLQLFARGELHGTVHTCVGQELSAVALARFLKPEDTVFSTHRGHGHYLAVTDDLEGLLAELMAREGGCVRGLGGSQHLQNENFHASGIQGGLIPVAAGAGWGHKLGSGNSISLAFFGDGTLGQGVLYETLNITAKWALPVLFVLEDNGVAQSTSKEDVFAADIQKLISAYGIHYTKADTWDWHGLTENCREAVAHVRESGAPGFLHIETYRLNAHSKGDDLRSKEEVERHRRRDVLHRLIQEKNDSALEAFRQAKEKVEAVVQHIRMRSRAAPEISGARASHRDWRPLRRNGNDFRTYGAALNGAYRDLMKSAPETLFLGEDVRDPYGGCFRITEGLSEGFPERVRNTPISESAITGLATGAALTGKAVFVEWMFGDFSLLAADQVINQAAKLRGLRTGRDLKVFFRTPMGGGRGYGPTHSQSLEKHFLGVPDLDVFYLNCFIEPTLFFPVLLKTGKPALICENKTLYTQSCIFDPSEIGASAYGDAESFDVLLEWGEDPGVLILTYGAYARTAAEACGTLYEKHGRSVSLLVFAKLSDYNAEKDMKTFERFETFLSFEEGAGYAGFFAEVAAQMAEWGWRLQRRGPPVRMIPAAAHLEKEFYFSPGEIVAEILEALDER